MPTYSYKKKLSDLKNGTPDDYMQSCSEISSIFAHGASMYTITDIGVQAGNLRFTVDVTLSPADLAHLNLV